MRIFIVGFTGCGKSTYGKFLADFVQIPFIDLDKKIMETERRSIDEIFSQSGEDYFRLVESRLLKTSIQHYSHFIMATGGGTPCFHDNMQLLNQTGVTIFLEVSHDVLKERLLLSGANRPLVKNLTEIEMERFIQTNLKLRLPYYAQSKIKVNTEKLTVSELLQILEGYKSSKA